MLLNHQLIITKLRLSSKQIKNGALISYIAIFINIAVGLIYTPWMIRQIGKADYGLYILMTSVLTYFTLDYGLSQAVTRLLAKYKTENNNIKFNNLLSVTAKLYLLLDVLIIFALILFYVFIEKIFVELSVEEIVKLKDIYIIAATFSVLSFPLLYVGGVYYACELFSQIKLLELISKLGTVFFTVIVLFAGYGLTALVFVYASMPFLVNILKIIFLKQKGVLNINWKFWDNKIFKEVLSTSVWLFIILIGELLLKKISPTILGVFSGTEEIAIFSIANTFDGYILVFATALNGLFLPKMSNYLIQKNKERLVENLMIKVGRFQVILVGFITLSLILLGKDFIYLWVGDDFSKSYYVLIFLILPTFIFSLFQLGTTYILALNKLKFQAYIYILAAVSNIILSIIFTPKYGSIGSGISIFISKMVFYIFGFIYVFHTILNINMLYIFKSIFRNIFVPLILTLLFYIAFDYFTMTNVSILSFLINCLVLTLIFTVLTFVFYINQDEKQTVFKYIKKVLSRI